jgi:ferrochelatase
MKFTIVPAFYNKPDYLQNLADSIKGHLEGYDYDHLLFSYHGVPERHIRKTDITKSHCKIDGSCCNTPSPAHEFCYRHQCYETTKQVVKLLGIQKENTARHFNPSRETSIYTLHGCSSEQNARKGIKISGSNTCFCL